MGAAAPDAGGVAATGVAAKSAVAKGAEEAGEALVKSFVKDIAGAEPSGDPEVMVAFVLGWQMSELYRPGYWRAQGAKPEADLPGLGRLGGSERARLRLKQLEVGIRKLEGPVKAAGLAVPSPAAAAALIPAAVPDAAYEKALFELHVELLTTLTAAHFKLGKAYGLGRALADTTRIPKDAAGLKAQLDSHRIANLLNWLADLTSLFPPHAGRVVHDSLEAWRDWAADAAVEQGAMDKAPALLERQGQRWRSLLSGEKHATDALGVEDYVKAGELALSHTGNLAGAFLSRYKWPVLAAVSLFAVGLGLVIWDPTGGSIAAGLAGVVASLGITWKSVGASLGDSAAKMERPVWEGALDTQIAISLALVPGTDSAARYVPPRNPAG